LVILTHKTDTLITLIIFLKNVKKSKVAYRDGGSISGRNLELLVGERLLEGFVFFII